jgi:hypothetical protein
MKVIILLITLTGLLVVGGDDLNGQMYGPYTYGDVMPYQPYPYPQEYDPYYDLHVMHYQLYRQYYSGYPAYQPCCYVGGIPPMWAPPAVIVRQRIISPRPEPTGKHIRAPRAFKRR